MRPDDVKFWPGLQWSGSSLYRHFQVKALKIQGRELWDVVALNLVNDALKHRRETSQGGPNWRKYQPHYRHHRVLIQGLGR